MDQMPVMFWALAAVIAAVSLESLRRLRRPSSWPILAVLATVSFWYLGDLLYHGPEEFAKEFDDETLNRALFQVVIFVIAHRVLTALVTPEFLRGVGSRTGFRSASDFLDDPRAQRHIRLGMGYLFLLWSGLLVAGFYKNGWEVLGSALPPLAGFRAELFPRSQIGGGTSFLMSAASYTLLFASTMFGVLAVFCRRTPERVFSAAVFLACIPYYFWGHARNQMLNLVLPTLAAFALFSKVDRVVKAVVLLVALVGLEQWFRYVIATRHGGMTTAFLSEEDSPRAKNQLARARHEGLNMLAELCHINTMLENGQLEINWGKRYVGEALNFIPRAWWPGKPTVGFDYAIARGARVMRDGSLSHTVSTGMVGQGVTNFGVWFGPAAAALLVSLWTGLLSRFSAQRANPLRRGLFLLGLCLTFNTGRDVTFFVLFPMVFGYICVRAYEFRFPELLRGASAPTTRRGSGGAPAARAAGGSAGEPWRMGPARSREPLP